MAQLSGASVPGALNSERDKLPLVPLLLSLTASPDRETPETSGGHVCGASDSNGGLGHAEDAALAVGSFGAVLAGSSSSRVLALGAAVRQYHEQGTSSHAIEPVE